MATYEEERRRRIEENKKRIEELGLSALAKDISKQASKPSKPVVRKLAAKATEESVMAVRRSSRVASTSRPNYREDADALRLPRKSSGYSARMLPLKYCSQKGRTAAIEAAEKLQESLSSGCPSTIKSMLQSHVSGGFWLSLPLSFCKEHMPKKDTLMTLEDSEHQEFESLYLAYKNGLSGGWRGFSIDHELQDGDALVFELIEPSRLKVHIVRVADFQCDDSTKASSTKEPKKDLKASEPEPKVRVREKPKRGERSELVDRVDDINSEKVLPVSKRAKHPPSEVVDLDDIDDEEVRPVSKRTTRLQARKMVEMVVPSKKLCAAAAG